MTGGGAETDRTVRAASACAAAMIAAQVAGKATRDAVFLTTWSVTDLPAMLVVGAGLSLLVVLATGRLFTRFGPSRVVPPTFVLSAALFALEWLLMRHARGAAAIALFLHLVVFGATLISGFWSVVNERFDPRTARQQISRIAGGATLGGLLGGVLAERVAAVLSMASMLPVLAAMHLVCGWLVLAVRAPRPAPREGPAPPRPGEPAAAPARSGLRVLAEVPYLRYLALLVLVTAVVSGLVQYVFLAQATARYAGRGEELMRFFALFYTAIGVVTFLVQSAAGRLALERLGLARTAALLPVAVAAGGAGFLLLPGLGTAALAAGAEWVLRASLFRSAYELHYTPVSAEEKRASKTLVDVGVDRLGDAVCGGLIRGAIAAAPALLASLLTALAVALAALALLLLRRLRRGYVETLERSLVARAVDLDPGPGGHLGKSSLVLQTLGALDLGKVMGSDRATERALQRIGTSTIVDHTLFGVDREPTSPGTEPSPPRLPADPVLARITDLRSQKVERIQAALEAPLAPAMVGHAIPLLAWDEVYEQVVAALRPVADPCVGQLLDALLDPDEDFAVRRRLPRVLDRCESGRAVEGLVRALADKRFEVRFQCGRALASIHRRAPHLPVRAEDVHEAVLREVAVDRRVWETHRLLDAVERGSGPRFVDDFLRQRCSLTLEHVFTMLSLVLPAEPLGIAFRGLNTDDRALRGTALEYLESVLPPRIRAGLWPFLEDTGAPPAEAGKSREEALQSLLASSRSIELSLESLRRKLQDEQEREPPAGVVPQP